MKTPEVPVAGNAEAGESPPESSASVPVETLKRRPDFLRAARARHAKRAGMIVQARRRRPGEAEGIRVGYTCSKKVGNAVARNRAKRRLRAVAHAVLPSSGQDGWDYVLIGKAQVTGTRPFDDLVSDLRSALITVHGPGN